MTEKVVVAFVQLDSGVVYAVYDFPLSRTPSPKPLPKSKGMTDEEVQEAWERHLRHLAHDE